MNLILMRIPEIDNSRYALVHSGGVMILKVILQLIMDGIDDLASDYDKDTDDNIVGVYDNELMCESTADPKY